MGGASTRDGLRARGPAQVFAAGVISTIVVLLAGRYAINRTTVADRLIAPLLRPDSDGRADVIVVPGAGVAGECTPNLNGTRRVLLAARLYREGRAPALLFAGGTSDGLCPVAEAMARQAVEVGVPAAVVYREVASRSTHENAELSAPLLRALGARRVLVVTDRLHMTRAERVFAHEGFAIERASVPIYEGHADNIDMLQAGVREGLALAYYRTRGWLVPGTPPPAAAAAAVRPPAMSVAYPDGPIVVLGASYAAGWSLPAVAGHVVINKGVAGEESAALLARFASDVVPQAPRAVILWGFINDIFRASGDMSAVLAGVRDHYTQMVAQARHNGIEPILATEVTARPAFRTWGESAATLIGGLLGKPAYQDRINAEVMAVNRWLVELASREGLLLLDFQAALAESSGRRHKPFSQPDGSHITDRGYAALTAYASPLLEQHFREH